MNLANFLSLLRIAFGAAFLTSLLSGSPSFALVMFVVAMMTDIADGYVARRLNQVTALGSALDGIADKTVLTLAFLLLAWKMAFPVEVAAVAVGYHLFTIMGFFLLLRLRKKIVEHPKFAKFGAFMQSLVIVIALLGLEKTVLGQSSIYLMLGVLLLATIHYIHLGNVILRKV